MNTRIIQASSTELEQMTSTQSGLAQIICKQTSRMLKGLLFPNYSGSAIEHIYQHNQQRPAENPHEFCSPCLDIVCRQLEMGFRMYIPVHSYKH